jgi:hypothetical protein
LLFYLSVVTFLPILCFCDSLILDDHFLCLSLVLGHSLMLHLILNSKFKLCAFGVANVLTKGDIEKPSGLCLGLFM